MTSYHARHLLLVTILSALSAGVSAREVRMPETNDATARTDTASDMSEEEAVIPASHKRSTAPARSTKAKPEVAPVTQGSGADTTVRPRWHSFLPGMFR